MRLFLQLFFVFSVTVGSLLTGPSVGAGDNMLMVVEAFARATAGQAKNGAAFLTVMNHGSEDDFLVAVETTAAKRPELHTHIHDNGIMRMRQVAEIKVPAGGSAALKPGGDHVMLMGLVAPLTAGAALPLVLVFKHAGRITVDVPIGSVAAAAPPGSAHSGHSGHSGHHMKPAKKN